MDLVCSSAPALLRTWYMSLLTETNWLLPTEPATSGGTQQPPGPSHSVAPAKARATEDSGELGASAPGRLAIPGASSAARLSWAYWASSMVGRTAASLTCPGLAKVASHAAICSGY